jgi:hypothetical protein
MQFMHSFVILLHFNYGIIYYNWYIEDKNTFSKKISNYCIVGLLTPYRIRNTIIKFIYTSFDKYQV